MTSETERALQEIGDAVRSVPGTDLDGVVDELLHARRIACYAGGREGLVMRGLVMRLFHAGLDAHYVGEMTCPAVGPGDLLVLSCGPGRISMVEALAGVARRDGARLLYLTAQPQNPPADQADVVVRVTAQTMADDQASAAALPMGSAYEIALFVLVDLITNRVRQRRTESVERLRSRHTNLE
ncbi:MAG: putative 6-phospho-3-hexuloisomerase [Blastococcus sp.]|jgi:6-phospho-3-hexuloisomerase|nr:putative 6-phospho-3-hexuloisomerase [Blastococcus sp.]